uniref:hypothetical chloroplast RF1 n=1 Tax=Phyllosiphon coccidium TaxID=1837062 RepID=UPI00241100DA|nr:hypothetical chloroplast RF1 [Phyllosiphon coccidium]WDY12772.1 hypothetical chloroplast RF1 [Phyllosiphon coccidium]
MSLATSVKDFADLLTDISTAKGLTGDFPNALLLQEILIYSGKSLISLVVYIFSFQWLKEISYLPLYTPQIDGASIFGDNLFGNPASHIFSFSSIPKQATDQLLAGFVNSFFFSLPVSLPHLVSLRRLFFQGPWAAAASVIGIVAANLLFLIGVVYGLRFLIIPYFSLEPLNCAIGVLTVAVLVKAFAEQKGFKFVPVWDKTSLLKMSALTFLLTWCEETSLFHSLNHLTLNAQNSCFDLYPCSTALNSFVVHTTYLLAFFVGHCLFSALFYFLILMGSRYLSSLRFFTTARVTLRLSRLMLFLIVAFTVSSFPYYGLDYLVTNVAGFLPEDPAYSNTLLSPTTINTKFPHFFKEIPPAQRDQKTALTLDLNYFDRGLYLNAPKKQKNAAKQPKNAISPVVPPTVSFEELNYQGEYAWIKRNQLSNNLSKTRRGVFTPIFKKPKQRYFKLRKLHDNRIKEEAQKADNRRTLGATTESHEGILPGERAPLFIKITDFIGRAVAIPPELRDTEAVSSVYQEESTTKNYESQLGGVRRPRTPTGIAESDERSAPLLENRKKDPIKEELAFEQKLQNTYSKGFAPPFFLPYERMRSRLLPIKNVIKKRYFLNKVYKSLLETDIDTFLARQPATYKLAENQESQLYEKRQILQRYYNWLRYYQPFEKMLKLRFQIPDSKSFVDRVYHQQFKGTLRVARRLFKVTFDSKQNPTKGRVLSYDQMLYNDLSESENPLLHEELVGGSNTRSQEETSLTPLQPLAAGDHARGHEEAYDNCFSCQPFIEESNSSPTYAGWDPTLRRFVVTNRFVLKPSD